MHFSSPFNVGKWRYGAVGKYVPETGDLVKLLNYYADSVNLPSKQVTTGTYNRGSAVRYATNSTFSQISINFRIPRSGETRVCLNVGLL